MGLYKICQIFLQNWNNFCLSIVQTYRLVAVQVILRFCKDTAMLLLKVKRLCLKQTVSQFNLQIRYIHKEGLLYLCCALNLLYR